MSLRVKRVLRVTIIVATVAYLIISLLVCIKDPQFRDPLHYKSETQKWLELYEQKMAESVLAEPISLEILVRGVINVIGCFLECIIIAVVAILCLATMILFFFGLFAHMLQVSERNARDERESAHAKALYKANEANRVEEARQRDIAKRKEQAERDKQEALKKAKQAEEDAIESARKAEVEKLVKEIGGLK